MKFLHFRKFFSGVFYSIGDAFDSAKVSPRRGTPPGAYPTDAKNELPSYTRNELVRRARYLEKNSGHIRGTLRDMKVYGIGDGIRPNAKSANSDWNRKAEEYFRLWSRKCDVTNRFSFREVQSLASRAIDVDGEVFIVKTYDAKKNPKIQVLETHRLVSESSEEGVHGGIKFGKYGEPLFYYFKTSDEYTVRKVPASAVLHICEPERVSYIRAFPGIQHSILDLLDRNEILSLEKHKVKLISDIARVITSENSNIDEDSDFNVNTEGSENPETDPRDIEKKFGGKSLKLRPGEKLEAFESNIPSPTFSGFLAELQRSGSLGVLPYEFAVNPSAVGGAAVRLVVSKAQRYIDDRGRTLDERLNFPIWMFIIGHAINNGFLKNQVGWHKVAWTHPKRATVDAGREEQQQRLNVEAGLKTLENAYSEMGLDYEDEMQTRATNARHIMRLAGISDSEPIPLWMLYKPQGSQIIQINNDKDE
nr:MAG TPA: portal protein [Caudoviricetes sp.]